MRNEYQLQRVPVTRARHYRINEIKEQEIARELAARTDAIVVDPVDYVVYNGAKRKDRQPVLIDCWRDPPCGKWVTHHFVKLEKASNCMREIWTCERCGFERPFGAV